MIDLLTTKQWIFLASALYGAVIYLIWFHIKPALAEARRDRAAIAAMLAKLGAAAGIDLTK